MARLTFCCHQQEAAPSRILVIGLQGSGKSLLVQQLLAAARAAQQSSKPSHLLRCMRCSKVHPAGAVPPPPKTLEAAAFRTMPTIGTELHKLFPGCFIREVGGAMRQLWHHYYAEATVVVFVVDSACPDPAGGSMSPADVGTEAPANVVQPQLRQQQEHTALGSRSPNDQQAACHAAEAALIASAADIESGAATICSAATAANRRADAEVHCGDNAAAAGSLDPAANEVMAAKHPALNAGAQDDRDMALTVEAQECREPVPDLQLSGEGLCHNDSPDEGEVEVQLPGKEEHIPLMCHTNTASQAPLHKRPHVPLADVFDGVISHPHMQGKPICLVVNKADLLQPTLQQPQCEETKRDGHLCAAMDEQALETDNFIRYNNLLPKNMQLLSLDCPQASNMEKECVISASTNHSSSQILPIRILTSAKTGFGVETLVQWLQNCHQEPSH